MMNPLVVMAGIGFVKALVVSVIFALNVGVILTWVERRMRGMIQDSVGPNRAAIPLPGVVAAGVATGPAFLLAGAVLWAGFASSLAEGGEGQGFYGKLFLQVGIFLGWVSLAAIARVAGEEGAKNPLEAAILALGGPRLIAIFGLCAHLLALIVTSVWGNTETNASLVLKLGALVLAATAVAGAGHVGASLAKEKVVRVTLLGLLHPLADGLKTAFKADFVPPKSDQFLFNLAPWIAFFPALVLLAVVPFGPALCFGKQGNALDFTNFQGIEAPGHMCEAGRLSLQVADLNVGILYFFAMAGTGIVGAALAGWASDNKFSLLGGMRAASQMVSYEVTLGLTVVGLIMIYGSVRVDEMVLWQANHTWGIFVQPLAFFLFMAAAIAETKRVPFDVPEGESEIVAGFYTEYSGMKFAMFFFSEFIAVVSSSALISALFLGGWHMPFMTSEGLVMTIGGTELFRSEIPAGMIAVLGALAFVGKTIALCVLQIIIRWTLPRFRYDQLMRLGWRKLLPVSLLNLMLTAIGILGADSLGPAAAQALTLAGELSMALVMLLGAAAVVSLSVYLLTPREKQVVVATSAARFARALGGIREAKLEA
jgi:NADH-quinone oxidoreductase subunit H